MYTHVHMYTLCMYTLYVHTMYTLCTHYDMYTLCTHIDNYIIQVNNELATVLHTVHTVANNYAKRANLLNVQKCRILLFFVVVFCLHEPSGKVYMKRNSGSS